MLYCGIVTCKLVLFLRIVIYTCIITSLIHAHLKLATELPCLCYDVENTSNTSSYLFSSGVNNSLKSVAITNIRDNICLVSVPVESIIPCFGSSKADESP